MAKHRNVQYKIAVRVGKNAGAFEPGDEKPILTLGAAHAYAEDLKPQAHEIVIYRQEVVARIKGDLSEGLNDNGRT